MKASIESSLSQSPAAATASAHAESTETKAFSRPLILILVTIAAVAVCAASASVASHDSPHAVGIVYAGFSFAMFSCAAAFLARALSTTGALHVRWTLIAAGTLAAAIGYVPSAAEFLFNSPPERVFQTACFNASEALYMLAAVLFFAAVSRAILIVDALQALLFILLRFELVYSPVTHDHFTINHLLIGQFMALFLFIIATVGCLGAASRTELRFLRTLSCFFGLRMIGFFLSNQVSFTWLHHELCSLWDVPGTVLLSGFSLYILYTSPSTVATKASSHAAEPALRAPSVTVRNLMPSFLAVVNLFLGLFLLRISGTLAAVAIALSLMCYVLRTALLQAQSIEDKASLQSRNEQLEGLAMRDPLTGVGNRRSLAGIYQQLQAGSPNRSLSLLLMDIDQFKQANDSHGHQYGDLVLTTLAETLKALAAHVPASHCVRMGGDEFALLLPNVAAESAIVLAEELRARFSAHRFQASSKTVSLSIGIASLQAARDLPLETLASRADKALYRAKQLGRDRVEVQPVWKSDTASADDSAAIQLELQTTS